MYQETPLEEHKILVQELIHIATELGFMNRDWGRQTLKPLQEWLADPTSTLVDSSALINLFKEDTYSKKHPSPIYLAAKFGYEAIVLALKNDRIHAMHEAIQENDLAAMKCLVSMNLPMMPGLYWVLLLDYALKLREKDLPDSLELVHGTEALLLSLIATPLSAEILNFHLPKVIKNPRMTRILDAMLSRLGEEARNLTSIPVKDKPLMIHAVYEPELLRVLLIHGIPYKEKEFIADNIGYKTPIEWAKIKGYHTSVALLQDTYVKEFYGRLHEIALEKQAPLSIQDTAEAFHECRPNTTMRLYPPEIFSHIQGLVEAIPDPEEKVNYLKVAYLACAYLPITNTRVYSGTHLFAHNNEACRKIKAWIEKIEKELGASYFPSEFYQVAKRSEARMLPLLTEKIHKSIKDPELAVFNYYLTRVEQAETTALKRTLLQEGLIFLEKRQNTALAAYFDHFHPKTKASWIMHLQDWLACLDEKTYTTSKGLYFSKNPLENGTLGLPQELDARQKNVFEIHRI
jgi:hypothetical protein